jgi:hypothetical protein
MRFLTAITVALFAGMPTAQAACTLADIADNWTTSQTATLEICGLRFYTNGKLVGTCRTYKSNGEVASAVTVFGTIAVDAASCSVRGTIREGENGTRRVFEGNMTEDKAIIVGTIKRRSGFIAYRNLVD